MWLRLDLESIDFWFKIDKYVKNQNNYEGDWAEVSFSFKLPNVLNYSKSEDEILMNCEVDDIRDSLGFLLEDKIRQETICQPIEPDFEFILSPKLIDKGKELADINMELKVHLWEEGALTCNYFSVWFDRDDVEALYTYLCLVTGKINKNNPKVQELKKDGILNEYY